MSLPLPRVVPDVGPGGGLVTAMGGINKLSNDMILQKINQIKKQYAPLTTQAEAASKLAYANLMGPQFLAKLLGNDSAIANMGSAQAKQALQQAVQAGMGHGNAQNIFSQMQQAQGGPGQRPQNNSLTNVLADKIKSIFGGQGQPVQQMPGMPQQGMGQQQDMGGQGQMPQGMAQPQSPQQMQAHRPKDGVRLEGNQWYNSRGEPVYEEDVQEPNGSQMQLELTKGIPQASYAENTGQYKSTVKQREEEGKYRAEALKNLGEASLGLSNSGNSLDRMATIIKTPTFQNMRSKFPFFQDKQLGYLMKKGTPEEKKLIGDFIATSENIIATGVQAFGNKPLVREFDLLKRQKVSENDPVHVAEGKLRSSIALHDIMQKKNQLVSGLVKQGYNESDAVQMADKQIDVSAIEKATDELLRDKPTEEDIAYMAQKRGISPDEVRKLLKAKGY